MPEIGEEVTGDAADRALKRTARPSCRRNTASSLPADAVSRGNASPPCLFARVALAMGLVRRPRSLHAPVANLFCRLGNLRDRVGNLRPGSLRLHLGLG